MAEGSETSGGGLGPDPPRSGLGSEGRGQRGESDLLAERRARRAGEPGEQVLVRRAEAAEATVRTLESHVASLQQRLSDAEHERLRLSALIQAERASPVRHGGATVAEPAREAAEDAGAHDLAEQELRRLRQREYAEQRQRLDAEERVAEVEREKGTEVERLRRRLSDSEGEAGMLAERLQQLRRELAEAEQGLAAERAALRQVEAELAQTAAELEHRVATAERELESERVARERAERALELVRSGHRKLEALVAELKAASGRLRDAAARGAKREPAATGAEGESRAAGAEAGSPAAGATREFPAAEAAPVAPAQPQAAEAAAGVPGDLAGVRPAQRQAEGPASHLPVPARNGEMVEALAAAVERLRARMAEGAQPSPSPHARAPQHKHSMSLIGRLRMARKQRRQR